MKVANGKGMAVKAAHAWRDRESGVWCKGEGKSSGKRTPLNKKHQTHCSVAKTRRIRARGGGGRLRDPDPVPLHRARRPLVKHISKNKQAATRKRADDSTWRERGGNGVEDDRRQRRAGGENETAARNAEAGTVTIETRSDGEEEDKTWRRGATRRGGLDDRDAMSRRGWEAAAWREADAGERGKGEGRWRREQREGGREQREGGARRRRKEKCRCVAKADDAIGHGAGGRAQQIREIWVAGKIQRRERRRGDADVEKVTQLKKNRYPPAAPARSNNLRVKFVRLCALHHLAHRAEHHIRLRLHLRLRIPRHAVRKLELRVVLQREREGTAGSCDVSSRGAIAAFAVVVYAALVVVAAAAAVSTAVEEDAAAEA
ncbi:hypothetical protein C8R44DRAFT_747256 [Mycena epipterygia]|nr:hypothetical protein C8R44DRAFT_747256 [Mycena epipterygia]